MSRQIDESPGTTPPPPHHVLEFTGILPAPVTNAHGARMDSSNKIGGTVLAIAVIAGAIYLVLNVKSDRAKFDALRVGMSTSEVQAIVGPKTGRYNRFHTDIGDNETLYVNDVMELTIRGGRLADKRWTGKDRGR